MFGGEQLRPNLHVEDMTDLYVQLLEAPDEAIDGKIWNAGYHNLKVREIANMVRDEVGKNVDIVVTPSDDHRSYHVSSEKIKRDLGFSARRTVSDAIIDLHAGLQCGQGAERDDRRPLLQHQAYASLEAAMNAAQGPNPAPFPGLQNPPGGGKRRSPPKAIQVLVPVWGAPYTSQFLEFSLPTLLSPGNLPALAKALPCKFVFLTSSTDAADLNDHAAIHYLRSVCDVEISVIDDLITGGNYSTTITLAYARAVRATGDAMLDTCFFFMISDYIVADGSLANVLARMQAGYSGVVAGNFQVVEESAKGSFFKTFDSGKPSMIVRSRELMRWALDHLHPVTLANMVNFPLCHTAHTNRLFWRVDDNTLIGRFYLMHMICIRPEIADFVIGSSCDYSFIPEMCPVGKCACADRFRRLSRRRDAESAVMNAISCDLAASRQSVLAASLAEWTTATHRKNAHSAVIFHAADLPPQFDKSVTQSGAYIDEIERSLPPPKPHRNHPYWLGAMAAHEWAVAQREKSAMPLSAADLLELRATGLTWWLYKIRNFIYGRPPNVRPWHPRWPDYRMFMKLARRHFAG